MSRLYFYCLIYISSAKTKFLQLGVKHCGNAASLGAKPQWGYYTPCVGLGVELPIRRTAYAIPGTYTQSRSYGCYPLYRPYAHPDIS